MNTKKLNKKWSEVIKYLFKGRCHVCKQPGTDAHHLIKRNCNGLKFKWHCLNGVWVCRKCHQTIENYSHKQIVNMVSSIPIIYSWYKANYDNKKSHVLSEEAIYDLLKYVLKYGAPYEDR